MYYTDKSVRCSTCGKLYGIWSENHNSLIKRAKDLINKTQTNIENEDQDNEIIWKIIER